MVVARPAHLLGLALLLSIPVGLVVGLGHLFDPIGLITGLVSGTYVGCLLSAALASATVRALSGLPASLWPSIQLAIHRARPVLILSLLCTMYVAAYVPVTLIVLVFGTADLGILGAIFGLLLGTAGGMPLCAFCLAIPVIVNENVGIRDAIRRSITLTRGHRRALFATGLILLGVWFLGVLLWLWRTTAWTESVWSTPLIHLVLSTTLGLLGQLVLCVAYHDYARQRGGPKPEAVAGVFE